MTPVISSTYSSSNSSLKEILNDPKADNIGEAMEEFTKIPFGEYIFKRLNSCGTKSVFGVPGDYNLSLLEHMYPDETAKETSEINWIGCCNELNAAYAADGYSRYTNRIGCLITTYGVGELSAINGIAGSFAENIKVLHIVGVVSSDKMSRGQNYHHLVPNMTYPNLQEPNYQIFNDMVENKIACSSRFLDNITSACDQVDELIKDIYKNSRPGYLFIPENFANMLVSSKNLIKTPTITLQDSIIPLSNSHDSIESLTRITLDMLYESKCPAIISDTFVDRYEGAEMLNDLIEKTNIWNFSTILGKSTIDESRDSYIGLFNGKDGLQYVNDNISKCDLVLHFGIDTNEVNSGSYTFGETYASTAKIIEFNNTYVRIIDNKTGRINLFKGINYIHILKRILKMISLPKLSFDYPEIVTETCDRENNKVETEAPITQDFLKTEIPNFLQPGDVLVCETGSFQFSVRDFRFPTQVKYITQSFYLSIGMALPASLGVGVGMRDYPNSHITKNENTPTIKPRLILCEGDGAAQMTIQELSTMLRYKIPMDIFLWNNNGYTIERVIRGPTRSYNDIQPWNWQHMLKAYGDGPEQFSKSYSVNTESQLSELLTEIKNTGTQTGINFVEVALGEMDVPQVLTDFVTMSKARAMKTIK